MNLNQRSILVLGSLVWCMGIDGYGIKEELSSLLLRLKTLSNSLIQKQKSVIELKPESFALLKEFAKKRGISLDEALKMLLEASSSGLGSSETSESSQPSLCPTPPPPAPPAPPVSEIKTEPLKITIKGKEKIQEEPKLTRPSLKEILEGRKGLRTTRFGKELSMSGEVALGYSVQQEKKSDKEFLKAFRDAQDIDEIIERLRALKDNPLYLKQEGLQEKKTPLPSAVSSGGLQLTKIIITSLLRRKNNLIFNFFDRDYLKDYMYDPDLFTQNDFDRLRDLIAGQATKAEPVVNRNLVSDTLFLNAFRGAKSIDSIVENLKALESNPQYLKQESFKAALRLPINDLLKKKNKLVLEVMQPGSTYLRDYLFDTSLFTQDDYDALKDLFT